MRKKAKLVSKKNKIKNFLTNDRNLILLSILFFVIYKFILISIAFYGRNLAPEPDDSYTYINLINLVYENGLFSNTPAIPSSSYLHILYTPYVFILALLAKLLFISPEEIFKLSFYFGTILLAMVLVYFLNSFTQNKKLTAFTIFLLALYNGSGTYHGFYWVVPSFFAFVLFLILATQIVSKSKNWYKWAIITSLLFVLIHPISIYATSLFILWPFFLSLIKRKVEWIKLKRGFFIIFFSVFWFIASRIYFISKGIAIESESSFLGIRRAINEYFGFLSGHFEITSKELSAKTVTDVIPISYTQLDNWEIIKAEYLNIIFPHPIFILIFFFFILILFKKRQYDILALYLSTSLFLIFSTITWFGYRSLGYLWPITFILLSYGIFFTLQFLYSNSKNLLQKISTYIVIIGVIGLAISLSFLNYIWAKNLNISPDFYLNKNCTKYLLEHTKKGDKVNYEGKTAHTLFLSSGLYERYANLNVSKAQNGEYLVSSPNIQNKSYYPENIFLKVLLAKSSRRNNNSEVNISSTKPTTPSYDISQPIKDCGNIKIYKIKK